MSEQTLLGDGANVLTGTGTLDLSAYGGHLAGYCCVDGTHEGTFELRDTDDSGALLFLWGPSLIASPIWPTTCPNGTLWYSVSGTGAYAVVSALYRPREIFPAI